MIRPHTASDLPPGLARLAAAKVAKIDAALAQGERSGLFEGDPFASVRAERRLGEGA